jgi:hypothetical protein
MGSRYTPPVENDDGWFYQGIRLAVATEVDEASSDQQADGS